MVYYYTVLFIILVILFSALIMMQQHKIYKHLFDDLDRYLSNRILKRKLRKVHRASARRPQY